jgi:hypothetical protein
MSPVISVKPRYRAGIDPEDMKVGVCISEPPAVLDGCLGFAVRYGQHTLMSFLGTVCSVPNATGTAESNTALLFKTILHVS